MYGEDAADRPDVDLGAVAGRSVQQLGSSIPSVRHFHFHLVAHLFSLRRTAKRAIKGKTERLARIVAGRRRGFGYAVTACGENLRSGDPYSRASPVCRHVCRV